MTNPYYDNIDDLLIKVILREASDEEQRSVEDWVALDPANRHYLEDFTWIYEESRKLAIHSTVNEEDAWKDFRQRIAQAQPGGGTVSEGNPWRMAPWLKIAAVFLLLFAGTWLYYRQALRPPAELALYSNGQVLIDTLSEGTIVTLNKESSLQYRRGFAADSRPVRLEGEAFFNVSPDKDKPFIVHTAGASIKVLGTSFNVRSIVDGAEVIVETGQVEITRGQDVLRVGAGEKALIRSNHLPPVKEAVQDELYNYYRTHEFVCNGTPLWRLVEKLNEVYQAQIELGGDRLRNLRLTTTFHVGNDSLEGILEVVSKTLTLTTTHLGKKIILN